MTFYKHYMLVWYFVISIIGFIITEVAIFHFINNSSFRYIFYFLIFLIMFCIYMLFTSRNRNFLHSRITINEQGIQWNIKKEISESISWNQVKKISETKYKICYKFNIYAANEEMNRIHLWCFSFKSSKKISRTIRHYYSEANIESI